MTRKALIKESDLRRMAKLAKQHGVVVEQEVDGVIIRVSPFAGAVSKDEASSAALDKWLREEGAQNSSERSSKRKVPKDPIKEWHDSIGFDPKTMTAADKKRLLEEAEQRWLATIPSRPMLKSEKSVLRQLSDYGVGVQVDPRQVKSCGPGTEQRLKVRGYIELHMMVEFPDRVDAVSLTPSGLAAAKELDSE